MRELHLESCTERAALRELQGESCTQRAALRELHSESCTERAAAAGSGTGSCEVAFGVPDACLNLQVAPEQPTDQHSSRAVWHRQQPVCAVFMETQQVPNAHCTLIDRWLSLCSQCCSSGRALAVHSLYTHCAVSVLSLCSCCVLSLCTRCLRCLTLTVRSLCFH